MIGGLTKSVSRLAIVAAAGAMSTTGVMAADLGGNCCSDLEERVAELEATTARKGNRRVSLTVSGHVHEAIVFWDYDNVGDNLAGPDDESNIYIGTHNSSRSRFRFRGDATINSEWSAGFYMEFGVRANNLAANTQDDAISRSIDIRHEALFLRSRRLGTIWLGWSSAAADGITEICLGCGLGNGPDYSDDMGSMLSGNGVSFAAHGSGAGMFVGEGDRREVLRYISPTFAGFALSTSFGQDDYWDVALRFAREIGDFRVGFGIAYMSDTSSVASTSANISTAPCTTTTAASDKDCESLGMSGSIQHVPSGLYIASAYGLAHDKLAAANDKDWGWHITGGVNRRFNTLGNTNFWLMYTTNEQDIAVNNAKLDIYGIGINQAIDAAAMNVYLWYKHMDAEVAGADTGDLDVVTVGAIIRF